VSVIDQLRDIENSCPDGYSKPYSVGRYIHGLNGDDYDELSKDDAIAWIVWHNQWAEMDDNEREHLLALAALTEL